ncbi:MULTISPECIES: hypothetical protein [unclassified Sphingomonas]|uniref:hypothetical protein n=1 Tax=unclassified Sphingomonas TaxID=196159 RepID=UPI0022698E28|nr:MULTISPECIES: hypothetical protein [unclassified Sphingomonas]
MTKPKLSWIRLADARRLIAERLTTGIDPEDLLIAVLKSGEVAMRGQRERIPIVSDEVDYALYDARSSKTPPEKCGFDYKRGDQASANRSINHDETWGIDIDEFIVCAPPNDPEFWHVLSEIELKDRDLNTYLNRKLLWPISGQDGRNRASDKWLALTLCLLEIERNKILNNLAFPTSQELRSKIIAMFPEGLDERTIRDDVDAVFHAYVQYYDGTSWEVGRMLNDDFDMVSLVQQAVKAGRERRRS